MSLMADAGSQVWAQMVRTLVAELLEFSSIWYDTDSERFRKTYGIFPSGTSTTQCGFRELEEHPASFWMLRKWTESV